MLRTRLLRALLCMSFDPSMDVAQKGLRGADTIAVEFSYGAFSLTVGQVVHPVGPRDVPMCRQFQSNRCPAEPCPGSWCHRCVHCNGPHGACDCPELRELQAALAAQAPAEPAAAPAPAMPAAAAPAAPAVPAPATPPEAAAASPSAGTDEGGHDDEAQPSQDSDL